MADFMINDSLRFVSREEWEPIHPRLGHIVRRSDRTHVIIHHTVGPADTDPTPIVWEDDTEIFKAMRTLQTSHDPDLGPDVPYNFVAFAQPTHLTICEGRGEDRSGAHTKGHNTRGIAVSFSGNYEANDMPSDLLTVQLDALSSFLHWLKTSASHPAYGDFEPMSNLGSLRPDSRTVFAHRDFKPTACPGRHLISRLTAINF